MNTHNIIHCNILYEWGEQPLKIINFDGTIPPIPTSGTVNLSIMDTLLNGILLITENFNSPGTNNICNCKNDL